MKNKVIFILVMALMFVMLTIVLTDKTDIAEATIEELQEINGIGEVLSLRIVSYLKVNKTASVDDLDHIKGIGEIKLELIKKEFD